MVASRQPHRPSGPHPRPVVQGAERRGHLDGKQAAGSDRSAANSAHRKAEIVDPVDWYEQEHFQGLGSPCTAMVLRSTENLLPIGAGRVGLPPRTPGRFSPQPGSGQQPSTISAARDRGCQTIVVVGTGVVPIVVVGTGVVPIVVVGTGVVPIVVVGTGVVPIVVVGTGVVPIVVVGTGVVPIVVVGTGVVPIVVVGAGVVPIVVVGTGVVPIVVVGAG